ncbi:hypothetical protein KAT73_01030 [candidate division WOR-3 bacterium]|nr:hypothetical protein [candidate division WOR-3 bacterium]
MVKNSKILDELKHNEIKTQRLTYFRALEIFEAMWREALTLGVLPLKDFMEGVEVDIKVAKILNSCLNNL